MFRVQIVLYLEVFTVAIKCMVYCFCIVIQIHDTLPVKTLPVKTFMAVYEKIDHFVQLLKCGNILATSTTVNKKCVRVETTQNASRGSPIAGNSSLLYAIPGSV